MKWNVMQRKMYMWLNTGYPQGDCLWTNFTSKNKRTAVINMFTDTPRPHTLGLIPLYSTPLYLFMDTNDRWPNLHCRHVIRIYLCPKAPRLKKINRDWFFQSKQESWKKSIDFSWFLKNQSRKNQLFLPKKNRFLS